MLYKIADFMLVTLGFCLVVYFLLRMIQGDLAQRIAQDRAVSPFLDWGQNKEAVAERQKFFACIGLPFVLFVYLGIVYSIFHPAPAKTQSIPQREKP